MRRPGGFGIVFVNTCDDDGRWKSARQTGVRARRTCRVRNTYGPQSAAAVAGSGKEEEACRGGGGFRAFQQKPHLSRFPNVRHENRRRFLIILYYCYYFFYESPVTGNGFAAVFAWNYRGVLLTFFHVRTSYRHSSRARARGRRFIRKRLLERMRCVKQYPWAKYTFGTENDKKKSCAYKNEKIGETNKQQLLKKILFVRDDNNRTVFKLSFNMLTRSYEIKKKKFVFLKLFLRRRRKKDVLSKIS